MKMIRIGMILFVGALTAQAAEKNWVGSVDGVWANNGNWDAGVPGAADDGNFTHIGTGGASLIDFTGAAAFMNLDVLSGADSFTFGSSDQTISLSGNFITRNNAQTIDADIVLANNKGIGNRDNNDALTINGGVSGSGNVVFGVSASFDDGLIVLKGGVVANGGAGNISINGKPDQIVRFEGGSVDYNNFYLKRGIVQIIDNVLDSGNKYQIGNDVDGVLEYVGSGDLTLDQKFDVGSTVTEEEALTGGTVFKASQATGRLVVSGQQNTNTKPTVPRTVTLDGASTAANELESSLKDINAAAVVSLVKKGAGKWALTGVNEYTGTTLVEDGELALQLKASLYDNQTAVWTEENITVQSGATLTLYSYSTSHSGGFGSNAIESLINALSVSGSGGLEAGAFLGINTELSGDFTYGKVLADSDDGALGLRKFGANKLMLSGDNTFTGGLFVEEGGLVVAGNQSAATGLVTVKNTASLGGDGTVGGNVVFESGSTFDAALGDPLKLASGKTLALGDGDAVLSISGTLVGSSYIILMADEITGTFSGLADRTQGNAIGGGYYLHYIDDAAGDQILINKSQTTSSGVDLRAFQTSEGAVVEFVAFDVEADGSIMLVLMGEGDEVLWSDSVNVTAGPQFFARFVVPGLELGKSYHFKVRDEVGKWWDAPGVVVQTFTADMVSASLAGLEVRFDSQPDRSYEIQWTAALGDEWIAVESVRAVGQETSVVVAWPESAENGFFRVVLK